MTEAEKIRVPIIYDKVAYMMIELDKSMPKWNIDRKILTHAITAIVDEILNDEQLLSQLK